MIILIILRTIVGGGGGGGVVGVLTVERSPDLGTGNYPRPQSVLVRLPSSHGHCDQRTETKPQTFSLEMCLPERVSI